MIRCAIRRVFLGLVLVAFAGQGVATAGPILLGGDDLTDHGSRLSGANINGWLYIQRGISGMLPQVTRSGPFTTDIIAIGSADPGVGNYPSANAGGAINSVANVLGLTVTYVDGAAAINALFTNLGNGSVNGKILWISGTDTGNNEDSSEVAAVNANAAGINAFINSGGGVMSHGFNNYGWLSTLLPGLIDSGAGTGSGHTLTAAGMLAFPGLTSADINSGPSHSSFNGPLGGLQVLGTNGNGQPFLLGGGIGASITAVPEPATLAVFGGIALAGALGYRRRKATASV